MPLSMGKVLGGGSNINVMAWARGHKNDWDFFASESGDTVLMTVSDKQLSFRQAAY
jgi:choline dehydrogenase-like flavoprotein